MSPIRLPKLDQITSTIAGIRDRFSRKGRTSGTHTKHRRLLLDPLEQRQLLSLSPGDVSDTRVNELTDGQWAQFGDKTVQGYAMFMWRKGDAIDESDPTSTTAGTTTGQSTASDNDGDFVVTWTRSDEIRQLRLNPNGTPALIGGQPVYDDIIDPATGNTVVDTNIYARYFTDEVQRITLPSSLKDYGTFQLRTSNTIKQRLTLSATYEPFSGQSSIAGTFVLGYTNDPSAGMNPTTTARSVVYNENSSLEQNAAAILQALKDIPDIPKVPGVQDGGITVRAINSREFEIEYAAPVTNDGFSVYVNPQGLGTGYLAANSGWTSGFYPAAMMTTVSQPVVSYQILVSPDDPWKTAASIEAAFGGTGIYNYIAPTDFPSADRVNPTGITWYGPYQQPVAMWTTAPKISVKPVQGNGQDGLVFDVTFVGTSGKKDQPLMSVVGADGKPIANTSVQTLKETSKEFRVNPEEDDDQFTPGPDKYEQTAPAVAMDADGDFVITWQSEVPNSANYGSVTDVFARRFSPIGLKKVDSTTHALTDVTAADVRGYVVPGIRSWIDDVQTLEFKFDASATLPISGKFKLAIDGVKTEEINFNSNDLLQVAKDIQDRLVKIGYEGVQVKSLSSSNPYQFEVRFTGRSGGVKQGLVNYDNTSPLTVQAFSAVHKEGIGTLSAAQAAALSTFQVNTFTTNSQGEPAIGMDDLGNFVIAWAGTGQDLSFFNGIYAQRYDRYGGRVGNEFLVFSEDTAHHEDPYVALSNSGNFVVAWWRSDNTGNLGNTQAKVYDAQGNVLRGQFMAAGGGGASVAFDSNDNWVIAYSRATADFTGITYADTYATMYHLQDQQPIRPEFRVNSASITGRSVLWPASQTASQAMVDADGDLLVTYEGFGPDVSEDAVPYGTFSTYLDRWINNNANADLLPYVQQLWTLTTHGYNQPRYEAYTSYQYQDTFGNWLSYQLRSNGDVDGVIDAILIHAANPQTGEIDWATGNPLTQATNEQLGRLRAILDGGLGLLRGEANGIMYSDWDAAPGWNTTLSVLSSDNIINSQRDGTNAKFIVTLKGGLDWTSFVLRVSSGLSNGYVDVPITCARTNNVFDPERTIQAINNALESVGIFGNAWPETNYGGAVDVRRIYSDEVVRRIGTAWDLTTQGVLATDFIYEITFQGAMHDTLMGITTASPVASVVASNEVQLITVAPPSTPPTVPIQNPYFTLTIPAHNNMTGASQPIDFDSSSTSGLNTARAQIESFIRGYRGGGTTTPYQNATVTLVPGDTTNGPWIFRIVFNSTNNVPQLGMSVITTNPVTGVQARTMDGSVTGSTVNDGGDTDGPAPVILRQTYGDSGTTQTAASSGMETDGDFVTTWTQYEEASYSSTPNIYYRRFDESTDTAGPLVTDVGATSAVRPASIDENSTIFVGENGLRYLVLSFDEDMRTTGADSVTNAANYRLLRNGVELRGAILKVEYGLNKASQLATSANGLSAIPSNKYEAVLLIDGNGDAADPTTGVPALSDGTYTLMALTPVAPSTADPDGQSGLRDSYGNPLGYSGFAPLGRDFVRHFTIQKANSGDDSGTDPDDSGGSGTYDGQNGRTYPETPGAVAVDGDGDHIRVWTAYDPDSGVERVYVAIYDADGNLAIVQQPGYAPAQLLPFAVTEGDSQGKISQAQRYASVACDKDGDFVVTWTQDEAQGDTNIYAQRFSSDGKRLGDAFRVNSYTPDNQKWSNVAMDVEGDFVITWSGFGQENSQTDSSYGVYARRFDSTGAAVSGEFQVNQTTSGDQRFSSVAMGADGRFAITWTSERTTGEDILARVYNPLGFAVSDEVVVNTTTAGDQWYSDIATNLDGSLYAITWSSADQDGSGWGVYTRLFDGTLTPVTAETLVNTSTTGDQRYSSVGMAYNGTFVVTWSGMGTQTGQEDDVGVYYQRFDAAGAKVGTETRVNNSVAGDQYLSSIGCDGEGNFVVAWTGAGAAPGTTDVYKYASVTSRPVVDQVGPIVTDVLQSNRSRIHDGDVLQATTPGISSLIVVFDEELSTEQLTAGLHSVLNPQNWTLERNGSELIGAIKSVSFTRNAATRKWEATLTLDGNGLDNGTPALSVGSYRVTVHDSIWDSPEVFDPITGKRLGNALDGDLDGVAGTTTQGSTRSGYVFRFSIETAPTPDQSVPGTNITTARTYPETPNTIASDGDGDYVVVWTAVDPVTNLDRVYARRFKANGTADGAAFAVDAASGQVQRYGSVACDEDGDFIVTWTQYGANDNADIYARRFSANKTPMADAFRVNTYTVNQQKWSNVAMDVDGDFVVTWSSYGQEDNNQLGMGYGVYARRFDSFGQPQAAEFRVNVTTAGNQQFSNVAMAHDGGFVVAWTSDQNGSDDIFVREFDANGVPLIAPLDGEQQVNQTVDGQQRYPDIAMNESTYVVTWSSAGQDGSGWGTYARRFARIKPATPITTTYTSTAVPLTIPRLGRVVSTLQINDDVFIQSLNVHLDITHPRDEELEVHLIGPDGTDVLLFQNVPRTGTGANFSGTVLDDAAQLGITNPLARPPFTGSYIPEQRLDPAFRGKNAAGTWQLVVIDREPDLDANGNLLPYQRQTLNNWSLEVTRQQGLGGEFLVNTTTDGDQLYSSVAMANDGSFAITWTGQGDQTGEEDDYGIFCQRYSAGAATIGQETRVNNTTAGYQYLSSIASDAEGNVVIAWTGQGNTPSDTTVYCSSSFTGATVRDNSGPIVTDVLDEQRNRLLDGDVVDPPTPGMSKVIVVFDENLNTDLTTGPNSVLNPLNWALERNGTEIIGAVKSVSFGFNATTQKYEAVVTLDSNGVSAGSPALISGDYVLTVRDRIWDAAANFNGDTGELSGNYLDGDRDGTPGTTMSGTGYAGFKFHFTVTNEPQLGAEFRVNDETQYEDTIGPVMSRTDAVNYKDYAREESTRAVAIDHDGDFAVVWTRYDASSNGDVYLRLFDRNNNALTATDILVNQFTDGQQRNASVAMDADGDLIVVWESEGQDPDGSTGIYARRFSATGTALGGEFRVNSNTVNDQANPDVACDDYGNFVIVWATAGQSFSYFNDIHGQRYDSYGNRLGSEFLVNQQNVSGAAGSEVNPAVATNNTGNFVVTWDQASTQINGVVTNTNIYFRQFNADGTAAGNAARANAGTATFTSDATHNPKVAATSPGADDIHRTARNSQIAMAEDGSFLIAWEAYQDNDLGANAGPESYGIYFRRFNADGTPEMANDHQANLTITDTTAGAQYPGAASNSDKFGYDQMNPSIAMDADGDYAIVWDGNGATPHPLDPTNPGLVSEADTQGIFVRNFHAQDQADGVPEYVTVQSRVNRTGTGTQKAPTIAMEPDGDMIVVWSGNGVGDRNGIFARRYDEKTDTAGPMVTDFLLTDGTSVAPNTQLTQSLSKISVVFDEAMWNPNATDPNSVTNPANYHILKNGVELVGAVAKVDFLLNATTNKWEAVLTLDGDGVTPGVVPLGEGQYQIVVDAKLRDAAGNPLNSTGLAVNGGQYSRSFNITEVGSQGGEQLVNLSEVGSQLTQPESPQPVASDADGNYVAVWTDQGVAVRARIYRTTYEEGLNNTRQSTFGPGIEITVAEGASVANASVAMDADGDFVVTWSQDDGGTSSWNVYAQRFNALGQAKGQKFRVNTYTDNIQRYSTIAMDQDGDFLIAWQSFGQDGSGYGIYAQRYSPAGTPLGGSNEVQVLEFENCPVGTFKLAWDFDSDPSTPAMVTDAITFTGNLAQAADAVEKALNDKANATLGFDPAGNRFEVVAISQTELGIRFTNSAGGQNQKPLTLQQVTLTSGSQSKITIRTSTDGATGEFRVNDTTANSQVYACAAMSAQGDIVVSWTSFGQDGDAANESNVYAKTLPANTAIRGNTVAPTYESLTQTGSSTVSANIEPKIIASDSPDERLAPVGTGVCLVDAGAWYGSGTLLSTGRHVLTAAHVVTDDWFGNPLPGNSIQVTFNTANGPVTIQGRRVYSLPSWAGTVTLDFTTGEDIAILELDAAAPASIPRYDIYREDDEIGKIASLYGYGWTGTGNFGPMYADQQLRWGQNRIDCTGDQLGYSADVLMYDFDGGTELTDTFGLWLGIHDLGMGTYEATIDSGDSGGPSFIDGKIAGVHSFGDIIPIFGSTAADTRVSVHAEWIDQVLAGTSEFLVSSPTALANGTTSTTTVGNQMWSSVAMDADGDFVITWTSEGQDGVGNGYGANVTGKNGVYARRFGGPTGGALGAEFQVNSYAADDQQHSRVDLDADGDFVVVWESFQDNPQSTADNSWGIYAQRYVRSEELGQKAWYGANGELGGEFRVNGTLAGDQRFPGVALDDTGDYVVVWSGQGTDATSMVFDDQGVFLRSFTKTTDDAGPTVTNVSNMVSSSSGTTLHPILDGVVLDENVTKLLLNVSEELSIEGGMNGRASVLNPQNWQLTKDGEVLGGVIRSIELGGNGVDGFNPLTGKYEIKVILDADPTTAAIEALGQGEYVLTMKDRIEDQFGNRLDGNLDGRAGGNFNLTFSVYLGLPSSGGPGGPGTPSSEAEDSRINLNNQSDQNNPVVASNAAGDYVVVWTTYAQTQGGTTAQANTMAQRFDRYGKKLGGEFLVNTYLAGDQSQPDVAMDDFGNFVVVWAGMGEEDTAGIYARRFDASGNALDDEEFCANQYRVNTQSEPHVAMDADGDFVISWTSYGQDGDKDGIYARRYNFNGLAQDNSGEFLVNTTSTRRQKTSDIAMDDNGNFTIVWMSEAQDGSFDGVYGQRFTKTGQKLGGEFRVNQTTNDNQNDPQIAMDADGDFVVAWSSKLQDGSGYGVYARRYSKAGVALSNEFRVNETAANWQHQPAVSMDDSGKFVVTWTTFDQDSIPTLANHDNSIYARMYNADGMPIGGEFRVNATEEGNQVSSDVAMDEDGDFTVVWVGPDSSGTGIFNRVVGVNAATYTPSFESSNYSGVYGYDFGLGTTYATGSLNLTGTSGNDLLEFVAATSRSSWTVKLNGVVQTVTADIAAIHFDGLGGTDTVRIVGTEASESVELWPDHLAFTGLDYTFDAQHIEVVQIDGKGGNDTAVLHDSAGNDTLTVTPTVASFNGAQFAQTLSNFETVKAYAQAGGNDTATLYGSADDDLFTGSQSYGELRGKNYTFRAESFDTVTADGRNGGNDVAELYDSAGDDVFAAAPTFSTLGREGVYLLRTKYFETVTAISTLGGMDVARFEDSKGDDTFTAKPTYGEMAGPGFLNAAKGFDKLYAKATSGHDVANLYDSVGDDRFEATPTEATFQVNGASYEVSRFDVVQAYATAGGNDSALLYDSAGNDTFQADPTSAKLWNRNFQNIATGFDAVMAYAAAGGTDTAILSDSAGDDLFIGQDQDSRLYGSGFYLRAKMFDKVYANAQAGGNDTAQLFGTPNAELTTQAISAYSMSSLSDSQGTSANHLTWLTEFDQIQVKNAATQGGSSSTDALDKIFSAFWGE